MLEKSKERKTMDEERGEKNMKYIYNDHLGGTYISDRRLDDEELYCESCGDTDYEMFNYDEKNKKSVVEAIEFVLGYYTEVCGFPFPVALSSTAKRIVDTNLSTFSSYVNFIKGYLKAEYKSIVVLWCDEIGKCTLCRIGERPKGWNFSLATSKLLTEMSKEELEDINKYDFDTYYTYE